MNSKVIKDKEALESVLVLLQKSKLPYQDITLGENLMISYHDATGKLIGSGGLEFYGDYSLLRSIVVDESQRGKSIGKQITADLLSRSKSKSNKAVYLLTGTAHDFFLKLGFKDVSRHEVPDEVKLSYEFTTACPASAVCMVYQF